MQQRRSAASEGYDVGLGLGGLTDFDADAYADAYAAVRAHGYGRGADDDDDDDDGAGGHAFDAETELEMGSRLRPAASAQATRAAVRRSLLCCCGCCRCSSAGIGCDESDSDTGDAAADDDEDDGATHVGRAMSRLPPLTLDASTVILPSPVSPSSSSAHSPVTKRRGGGGAAALFFVTAIVLVLFAGATFMAWRSRPPGRSSAASMLGALGGTRTVVVQRNGGGGGGGGGAFRYPVEQLSSAQAQGQRWKPPQLPAAAFPLSEATSIPTWADLDTPKADRPKRFQWVPSAPQHTPLSPVAHDGRQWSPSGPCGAEAAEFPFAYTPADRNAIIPPRTDDFNTALREVRDLPVERGRGSAEGGAVATLHTVEFARTRRSRPGGGHGGASRRAGTAEKEEVDAAEVALDSAYPLFGTPEGQWTRYCTQLLDARVWPECKLVTTTAAAAAKAASTSAAAAAVARVAAPATGATNASTADPEPALPPAPEALWSPATQRAYIASVACAFVDRGARHEDVPGTVFDRTRWFAPQRFTRAPKTFYSGWLDPATQVSRYPELATALGPYPCATGHFLHETLPRILWLHAMLPARVPILAHSCTNPGVASAFELLFRTHTLDRNRFVWHNTVPDAPRKELYFADTVYTAAEWPYVEDDNPLAGGVSTYFPAELLDRVRRAFVPNAPATAAEHVVRAPSIVVMKRTKPPRTPNPEVDFSAPEDVAGVSGPGSGGGATDEWLAPPDKVVVVDGGFREAGVPARGLRNHNALMRALGDAFPHVPVHVFDPHSDMVAAAREGRKYDEVDALQRAVALFSSASVVIGPHGAGFSNLVFCSPGTVVVEIGYDGGDRMEFPNLFAQLARGLALDYYLVLAKGEYNIPLDADVAQIVRVLTHGGERYGKPARPFTVTDPRFQSSTVPAAAAAAAAPAAIAPPRDAPAVETR